MIEPPSSCSATDGSISIAPISSYFSVGFATPIWQNNDTSSQITGLSPGSYDFQSVDGGCTLSHTFELLPAGPPSPAPLITSIYEPSFSQFTVSFAGGAGPWLIELDPGDGTPLQQINATSNPTYIPYEYADTTLVYTACLTAYAMCGSLQGSPSNTTCPEVNFQCPVPISPNPSSTYPTCTGSTTGGITLNPSGGVPPYSYSWNNGLTTSSIIGLMDGLYCVTVSDTNGCLASECIDLIASNDSIAFSLDVTPAAGTLGMYSVTIGIENGMSPFDYSWSTSATGSNVQLLSTGSYCATVIDANGCTVDSCFGVGSAYTLMVSGQLLNADGFEIITITADSMLTPVVTQAGPTGFFFDTIYVSNTQGQVNINFEDCYGNDQTFSQFYDSTLSVHFEVESCLPLPQTLLNGHLDNTNGLPVVVTVETGSTSGVTVVANSAGDFQANVLAGDTFTLSYFNCYGALVDTMIYVAAGVATVDYESEYCDVVPTTALVAGLISFAPTGTPVTITTDMYVTGLTVYTNPNGTFAANIPFGNVANPVSISFVDCDSLVRDTLLYINPSNVSVNYFDSFCDSLPSLQPLTVHGQLLHTNGTLVDVMLFADGMFEELATADSAGVFDVVLYVTYTNGLSVGLQFVDCNGNFLSYEYEADSNEIFITADYCPAPCDTMFTTAYDVVNNAFILEMDSTTQANAVYYAWDFGDGETSNDPYPTHVYDTTALYEVCLYTEDGNGFGCTYCHVIGFDSLGNIALRQNGDGFTLNVVPFGTADDPGVPEQTFELYPNPVNDFPVLKLFSDEPASYTVSVYNALGQRIRWLRADAVKGYNHFKVPLQNLVPGMYLMTIDFGNKT
ncbi:MAG TPA: T9SS type A sorting domain-containing protein, partial [Chitinophagales bacterium]|nr:T9SS type A sorting domain-containing protein [Chitinophagales bacterium]